MQLLLKRLKDTHDVLHMNHIAMRIEHLDKTAHVCALEFLGQIHKHSERRHRVLHPASPVTNLNRKTQPAHADLVNPQFPMVALALFIIQIHRCRRCRLSFAGSSHGKKITALPHLAKMFA